MKKVFNFSSALRTLGSAILLTIAVILPLSPMSCKLSDDDESDGGDTPAIVSCSMIDEKTVKIDFSEPVSISDVKFDEKDISQTDAELTTEKEIKLDESAEVGKTYTIKGNATNENGNTYSFSGEVSGFNSNPARLILSEIHTSASGKKTGFVELFVIKGGNLSGFEIVSGYYGEDKKYKFPNCEVSEGEYIVVHLWRSEKETGNMIDEIGTDLTKSTAEWSSNSRDFWANLDKRNLGLKKDVVVLKNNSTIVDAVLYSGDIKEFSGSFQKELANNSISAGIWTGATSGETFNYSDGINNANNSLSRQNVEKIYGRYKAGQLPGKISTSEEDWIVTMSDSVSDVFGATPGEKNSSTKYVKTTKSN